MFTYITCLAYIYTCLRKFLKIPHCLFWMLTGEHGEGRNFRPYEPPRIWCMLSAEGMKGGNTSGFMALQTQPGWDSLAVCCLCSSEAGAALCSQTLPGVTDCQQDRLNQLLEKSPGSLSKHSISSTETRAVAVPGAPSWLRLFEFPDHTGRWRHSGATPSTAGHY